VTINISEHIRVFDTDPIKEAGSLSTRFFSHPKSLCRSRT